MNTLSKVALIALSTGLLVGPVSTPVRAELQTADPGTPVHVAGSPYLLPSRASQCPSGAAQAAEQALRGGITAYCLPSDVSSQALSRWVRRYLPAGQPVGVLPWCDLRQLSDGGYFQRWGTKHTSGIVYSDPRSPSAQLVLVGDASPCP